MREHEGSSDTLHAGSGLGRAEVERVFEVAARRTGRTDASLLSPESVVEVAREVGLDEALVRAAIAEVLAARAPAHAIGRYQIGATLGRGGGGTVYKAHDPALTRDVALKVLNPDGMASAIARLEREARALARVRTPHVVAVYDVGTHEGRPYVAMELCEGGTLSSFTQRGEPIGAVDARRWLREAAIGLGAAADAGIIHRDVKPSNLLLDGAGGLKVADFGLAKSATDDEATLTNEGSVVGTLLYMSPEQARGVKDLGVRSDIYALGITFHHLLTGRPPFRDGPVASLIAQRLFEDRAPIATVAPSVPEDLARLIDAMVKREPSERPADWADVLARLGGTALVPVPTPREHALTMWLAGPAEPLQAFTNGPPAEVTERLHERFRKLGAVVQAKTGGASALVLREVPLLVDVSPAGDGARITVDVGRTPWSWTRGALLGTATAGLTAFISVVALAGLQLAGVPVSDAAAGLVMVTTGVAGAPVFTLAGWWQGLRARKRVRAKVARALTD